MIPSELIEQVNSGMSIVIGTRDASLLPECTRAWGMRIEPDATSVTLFITESIARRTIANLRDNGRIAIGCSAPTTHQGCQFKGTFVQVRAVNQADEVFWRDWLRKFKAGIGSVGLRTDTFGILESQTMLAIEAKVTEVYSLTPGPNAGERI